MHYYKSNKKRVREFVHLVIKTPSCPTCTSPVQRAGAFEMKQKCTLP